MTEQRSPEEKDRLLTAVRDLAGEECAGCGGRKQKKHSFCRRCYYKLPVNLRRSLYTPIGGGYEDVYESAKELLRWEVGR